MPKHTLDRVIKELTRIAHEFPEDSVPHAYYKIIVKYLKLECKYKPIVLNCKKPILHYFEYSLPQSGNDYFVFLYNPYNPVRFAVETFDSIEEIRLEINKHNA